MYLYSVNNKQEYFENSFRTKPLHNSFSVPLGKTLSELINLDYHKLIYIYSNEQNNLSYKELIQLISNTIDNVSNETKLLIEDLFIPWWLPTKEDDNEYMSELTRILDEVKTLMQLNICRSENLDFIKFHLRYLSKTMYKSKGIIERTTYVNKRNDYDNPLIVQRKIKNSEIDNYVRSLNIKNKNDIPDGNALFEGLLSHVKGLNKNDNIEKFSDSIYDTKLVKYLKSRLKYECEKFDYIYSLPQIILISFINCCANNIKIAKCEYCGNLYFKHGKSKYCCEGCLKAAKTQQKFNRNYTYIDSAGEKQTLIYDNILRNFEGKVSKVIEYVSKTDEITSDSSRKIIKSRLNNYKLMYRNERNNIEDKITESNNQNEKDAYYETVAELLYKVENLYTERNSLKNAVKDSIEQNKNIILKCPKLNGYNVVDDDFVIEYLE